MTEPELPPPSDRIDAGLPVLRVRPEMVTAALSVIVAVLVAFSTAGQILLFTTGHDHVLGFIPLFHVALEGNISTFFAAVLLLFAGLLAGLVGWRERMTGRRDARYWLGIAVLFVYLSLDEAAMIHERTIEPVREMFDTGGIFYFAWVIPALVLVLLVTLVLLPFLRRLPRRTFGLFALAGVVFVGGAVGMELVGGVYVDDNGSGTPVWSTLTTIEESMEMAGVVIFIHAVLLHLRDTAAEIRIGLRGSRGRDRYGRAAEKSFTLLSSM